MQASNQESKFQYLAFISYVDADARFAAKLQKTLERYSLPVSLSRQFPRSPRNLNPIGRTSQQVEETKGGRDEVREQMKKAKYLIVICSAQAVEAEMNGQQLIDVDVQAFISANPEENRSRVIPIIIREKDGARATACIPPAVKVLEILALDVLDKGYKQVCNQVVSRMIGIKPGVLWNRWQRDTRKKLLLAALISFVILLGISLGCGVSPIVGFLGAAILISLAMWLAWLSMAPYVVCYERYLERNNLPVGFRKLSPVEISHKACHYRFTYQRFRLRKVECCNSSGVPTTEKRPGFFHDEVSVKEIIYNEKGHVSRQIWRSEHGEILRVVQYESSNSGDWMTFRSPGGDYAMNHSLNKNTNTNSSVSRYCLKRNTNGIISEISFRNDAGNKCCDSDASWGIQYEIDSARGIVLAWYYLDKEGHRMTNRFGVSGRVYVYDAAGRMLESRNVDVAGNPCFNQDGYAIRRCAVDDWGNRTTCLFLDKLGNLCLNNQLVAKVMYCYDERGFLIEESYLDADERPCLSKNKISRRVFERDATGGVLSVCYYDTESKPCPGTGLYHKETRVLDSYGNCCISSYYNEQGEHCCNIEGISKQVNQYDEDGRACSRRYYNTSNAPSYHKKGYHHVTYDYDEYGNLCIESFFNVGNQPCRNADGIARIVREYDSHHNCIRESYYAPDCTPCVHQTTRISSISRIYDITNNLLREQYHGMDGSPCPCKNGYVIRTWEYDDAGRIVAEEYHDIDDKLCDNEKGYAGEYREYDKQGNVITRTSCDFGGDISEEEHREYDERGLLIRRYFKEIRFYSTKKETIYSYDNRGNLIRERYFDSDGNAVADRDSGVSEYRYEYDLRNRQTAEEYYGVDGLRCCNRLKVSRVETSYDSRDFPTSISYFGIDGNPCLRRGCVRLDMTRDSNGHITRIRHWSRGTKIESEIQYEYDANGNVLVRRFYDEFSSPATMTGSGISCLVNQYDKHNEKISETYYDENGRPCRNLLSKVARIEWIFDSLRRVSAVLFFDDKGKACVCSEGYAQRVIYYGEDGNVSKEEYYDAKGKLCIECVEYARAVVVADWDSGIFEDDIYPDKLITEDFFEVGILNYSYKLRRFDSDGKLRGEEFYNEAGDMSPVYDSELYSYDERNPNTWAKVDVSYDKSGNETCEEYRNWDGAPCVPSWRSYSSKDSEYDEDGRLVSVTFYTFDNDEPEIIVADEYGFARKELEYDEEGRLVQESFYDDCGELCISDEGYAVRTLAYDEEGRLIRDAYYDDNEELCSVNSAPARKRFKYSKTGQIIFEEYTIPAPKNLGLNELIAWEITSCAGKRYTYDESGRLVMVEFIDSDDDLCLFSEKGVSFARKCIEYNEAGQIVQEIYYNTDEDVTQKRSFSYDEGGMLMSEDFVDGNDELIDGPDDYARKIFRYDSHANCIAVEFFDSDENPRWDYSEEKGELQARTEYIYDENDRLIYEAHYDGEGRMISIKDTGSEKTGKIGREYACVTYSYPSDGKDVRIAHYYEEGECRAPRDLTNLDERQEEIIRQYSNKRPNERFEYQAFISYSSKDISFANKLQKQLESYVLPISVNKQHPRAIRTLIPIFRDRTDLEQGNLGEMLMRGLRASKYLLVICSKNSAQPNSYGKRYVDIEVTSFTSLNPENYRKRIIPILLRDEKTSVDECLPPAINELNLDYVDAMSNSQASVCSQIAARMMELNADVLRNENQRVLKNRCVFALLIVLLLISITINASLLSYILITGCLVILSVIALSVAWKKWIPVKVCYQGCIEEFNMPMGINKLSHGEQAAKSSYIFTYKNGILRNVSHCSATSSDKTTHIPGATPPPEIASRDIFYDDQGLVNRQLWYNAGGKVVREVLYESGKLNDWMTFRMPGNNLSAPHLGMNSGKDSCVTRYRLKRNQYGHIVEIVYCNDTGAPCADVDGNWGIRYDINEEKGQINSLQFINKAGEAMKNNKGIVGYIYEYDSQGTLVKAIEM